MISVLARMLGPVKGKSGPCYRQEGRDSLRVSLSTWKSRGNYYRKLDPSTTKLLTALTIRECRLRFSPHKARSPSLF